MKKPLEGSRAVWNRTTVNLQSDEVLSQLLDRGEMQVWRELYRLARQYNAGIAVENRSRVLTQWGAEDLFG